MKKLDRFSKHEFLDRTATIATLFNDIIINHVNLAKTNKKYKKKCEKISQDLWDLYQMSANLK